MYHYDKCFPHRMSNETEKNFNLPVNARKKCAPKTRRNFSSSSTNPGYLNNSRSQQMMQHLQQQQGDQPQLLSPQLHHQMPYPLFSSPAPFLPFGPMSLS
ncbi:unnamed protein product, partial [Candidula unifasciata]